MSSSSNDPVMVIGLGNLGFEYEFTRHNAGFLVVDAFAAKHGWKFENAPFRAGWCKGAFEGREVYLIKPHTMMNLSGRAVRAAVKCLGMEVSPENLIVVSDDIDLDFEQLRIKTKGGHGGHKGLISIMDSLGTSSFSRLRVGVGAPARKEDVVDYVLSPFSKKEEEEIPFVLERALDALELMIVGNFQEAMQRFNMRK